MKLYHVTYRGEWMMTLGARNWAHAWWRMFRSFVIGAGLWMWFTVRRAR
jgi:hypothetical protein